MHINDQLEYNCSLISCNKHVIDIMWPISHLHFYVSFLYVLK